jgi:hypothetical protein
MSYVSAQSAQTVTESHELLEADSIDKITVSEAPVVV